VYEFLDLALNLHDHYSHDMQDACGEVSNLLAVAGLAMPQEASAVSTKVYEFLDHALNLHEMYSHDM